MTMLAMISMGSVFGAALDTYNRFLQRSNRKSWLVFLNDILFWLAQGLFIFYVLFIVNQGELRFYIFIALLCGFAAYQSLLKGWYLRLLEIIISMIISIYKFIVRMARIFIFKPLHAIFFAVISIVVSTGKGLLALGRFIYRALLWIVKVIISPFTWILRIFWKFMPKKIKKTVDKLYNGFEGYSRQIKNYIIKWKTNWKNKRK
jgi:spore cortex biosynthesis protein YabQ